MAISTVALLAGLAIGATAGTRPVLGATLVGCLGAITLGAIDLVWMHIPARTSYGLATAVFLLFLAATVAAGDWPRLVVALGAGAAAFLIFGGAHLLSPGSIGFGDVRMAALVAMCAGWYGPAAVASCMLGALAAASAVSLVLLALGRASRHVHLPLGPFLAVSLLVAMALSA